MLRSIGSMTVLALLMVGCGGGGGGDSGPPPPPPPINGYTVSGTVSGLVGSGLTLAICHPVNPHGGYGPARVCNSPRPIGANGTFALGAAYPADYSGNDHVSITQQPTSPPQNCVISNAAVSTEAANDTGFAVACMDYSEYSYVTNAADNTLSSYSVNVTTGAVAAIGTPTATGESPYATAATAGYVFVGNEVSNDISAFAVDPTTGALTAVPGSPFAAGTDPKAMVIYQTGGSYNLYVANAGSDNMSVYTVDAATGALAGPSTTATGKSPTSIVILNDNLFVANHGGSNDISVFNIGAGPDAIPVPGSPFPAGGNPLSLALGANGQFFYSANPDATNPSISGFRVDGGGVLTPLSGSPFPLPVSHYIATDQTGAYLYVTSGASIVGYAIDATTGALTALPGFPVATGANAYSITIDPTNRTLYVTNDGAANVSAFTLDASTGALTPMAGSPFPAGHHPQFIATF